MNSSYGSLALRIPSAPRRIVEMETFDDDWWKVSVWHVCKSDFPGGEECRRSKCKIRGQMQVQAQLKSRSRETPSTSKRQWFNSRNWILMKYCTVWQRSAVVMIEWAHCPILYTLETLGIFFRGIDSPPHRCRLAILASSIFPEMILEEYHIRSIRRRVPCGGLIVQRGVQAHQ